MQQEADILLFEKIGIGVTGTTILGIVQLIGGLLMVFPKTRKMGAWVMLPTFILASIAVFANQMYAFGIVSILFIAMVGLVVYWENKKNIKNE